MTPRIKTHSLEKAFMIDITLNLFSCHLFNRLIRCNLQNLWFFRSSYQVLVIGYQDTSYATIGLAQ
ncbi:hypothetical protein PDESU_06158 [Pontiella desulfatans]|uniref:Uncharacterized protein n=1 Tax=Pontiella desulfatans TaxID=2750659 RepID=A0A6C2UDR4_PONDE|nr:hypothetical protein PDESU_06158 [Pontiella desulfatans]